MTISAQTNRYSYAGNGVTTDFAYSSRFLANADLVVISVNDTTGVETIKTLTTDYTVTGAGDANGGTVTMLAAPATGATLVIYNDPSVTQAVDLVNNDSFDVNVAVETPLDRLTLIARRIKEIVVRSLRQPEGDTADIGALPTAADRASKFLGFNSSGDPIALAGTTEVPVSAFMVTVLDDSNASEARDTLGVTSELTAALQKTIPQCGRLTLTSGVPVTSSDVTGATTVYFTPYKGNVVTLYDGADWVPTVFTELSQATTDNTKSPAAVANNSNYDIFVWNDAGTLRATRGPAWSSDTARGAGAGTTELELFEGRYVNKVSITNGPTARRGLYVGTVRSDGSAQINDSVAKRHVWNNYNRVMRDMRVSEGTNTWTYTTATLRQANNSAVNQLDYVAGFAEDMISAEVRALATNSAGVTGVQVGIGIDSTTVDSSQQRGPSITRSDHAVLNHAWWNGTAGIGRHTITWLEYSAATGTTTWYGDNGASAFQTGISGKVFA